MEKVSDFCEKIIRTGFVLLFILVPLILTPWNYELFEYNKMMATYLLTAIIAGAWMIKMIAEKRIYVARTPLDIPIALFVFSQLVSSLFSLDPHVSWFGYYSRFNGGMLSVITYILLYYAYVSNFGTAGNQSSDDRAWKIEHGKSNKPSIIQLLFSTPIYPSSTIYFLLKTMLLTGMVVALYGIAEHFGIDKNLWVQDVQNRVFSTLGQPNWLAAYLIALSPLAWGFALWKMENGTWKMVIENRKSKMDKGYNLFSLIHVLSLSSIFYFLLSILFFITLLWTRSRSGLGALAIADIVFWGIILGRQIISVMPDLIRHPSKILRTVLDSRFRGNDKNSGNDILIKFFLFIHLAFFLIVILNGTYIDKIDTWVTVKAWQNRVSLIVNRASTIQIPASTASAILQTSTQSATPLIQSGVTDSGDIRKYVWEGAINVWKSGPKAFLIGTGTETFAFAFYQFKPIGHNLTSEWDFLYNKAHNEYLNFLATTGILGLGTYLILIGSFIYWFIKTQISNFKNQINVKTQNSKHLNFEFDLSFEFWILRAALFAGWVSILITNFFGFSVVITQICFYLFPAMIFALTPSALTALSLPIRLTTEKQKISATAVGMLSGLCVLWIVLMWFADKQFASGYHLSQSGYLPQAYQALARAITLNPTEPMYRNEQSVVLATLSMAAWKEEDATLSAQLAQEAVKESDTALAVSPGNVNFWKSRTKVFYTLSSIDASYLPTSIQALEQATRLSPLDPKLYYNLAILQSASGQTDQAIATMKKSIQLKPNYREGYYGLSVLYRDQGNGQAANDALNEYLTKVDPKDEEFRTLIQ